jgi:hypothetical protein
MRAIGFYLRILFTTSTMGQGMAMNPRKTIMFTTGPGSEKENGYTRLIRV